LASDGIVTFDTHKILRKGFFVLYTQNFIEKVSNTQDTYIKSYVKKYNFIEFLKFLRPSVSYGLPFIFDTKKFNKLFGNDKTFSKFQDRLLNCGSYLTFRYYYRKDETKLHNANFCKADRLCPACAVRRAYKQQLKFMKSLKSNPELLNKRWYYIVIPVKHTKTESLELVYNRLNRVRKSITHSMRNNRGFWGQFDGGMGSIEVTKTRNGWNVHMNLIVCSEVDIPVQEIITKDKKGNYKKNYISDALKSFLMKVGEGSYIHNISKLDFSSVELIRDNLVEVLKYSLKFSSLRKQDLLIVYLEFYRKQLFFTFGVMRGLNLEDVELEGDEIVDDEFVEVIYRRVGLAYEKEFEKIKGVKDELQSFGL